MTDALRSLSGRTPSYGDATIVSLPAVSQRARMHRPSGELSARSMELLEARGLDAELCVRLDLQTASAPDGGGDWISIPFVKGGAVVNHKYRRVTKSEGGQNFAQDKGGAQVFWNYDAITDPTLARVPLVITEGEFDAMASIQSGFARSVSVPGGAPQQAMGDKDSGKYAFVADSLDDLADVTDIILAVDGDGPGVALMNDLALRLGRARCRYVVYHDGCKDLGDVLLKHGQRGVAEALNGARWVGVKGLFRMSELPPAPKVEAFRSGLPGLDEHYRLCRGDFCVMTGIPGHGKSTFVNDLACRMAERHGWTTAFASFEQDPLGDHRRALRTWFNRRPETEQEPEELERADMWIDRHFSFIVPSEDEDSDLMWLLEMAAASVIRHGCDMLVVDPWNELDHAKPRDQTLTEYVGWAIRQLKKFAKKYGVHLIVVAHPTKISKDKEGKVPMPTLYDISDSAAWFNKSDVGVIVHREDGLTKVRVAKAKYHDRIGMPGTVLLSFDKWSGHYEGAAA